MEQASRDAKASGKNLTAGSRHSIVITLLSSLLNYSIYTHCEDLFDMSKS